MTDKENEHSLPKIKYDEKDSINLCLPGRYTAQHSEDSIQCSTVTHSTANHSQAQHIQAQHSTAQHIVELS
jgi:hypothetical protein